ncbi:MULTISPECIES: hypothetical protein [unclassified Serratia (in: enterobacteria)]|uniref:phage baseplate protein n=1 Tax=unclassified Serratia (in: enterobacteria) TaxID=2647522 RepID=UPI0021025BC6|nr:MULTISPECIES: hypothetical protein [unclassified Serratia (in: enterobacteria)]
MQKVGNTTDTADANGEYTNGNVAQGIPPTIINAEMLNTFQRELVNTVEGAGIDLDAGDFGQLLKAIKKIVTEATSSDIDKIYPVGLIVWFAQNKNPNTLFPGTTWKYIGENRTIRLGKQDGSDLMQTGGADSVTLNNGNLPSHNHSFSANTSSFDYGTKWTTQEGLHSHDLDVRVSNVASETSTFSDVMKTGGGVTFHTTEAGLHSHQINIGPHSHSVSGTTGSSGDGSAFSIVNPYVKIMGWYRSA